MSGEKVVYVLGAGFSKPLGAPLLADLFTPTSVREALIRYHSVLDSDECGLLQRVYAFGRNYEVNSIDRGDEKSLKNRGKLWNDAEEFLAYLDSANHELGVVRRTALQTAMHPAVEFLDSKKLLYTAKRLLAAECSGFLEDRVQASEVWQAYDQWFARLTPWDTIISFNYDTVPESLANFNDIEMVLPGRGSIRECAQYYKLHGSTDWKVYVEGHQTKIDVIPGFSLSGDIEEYGMGYPGIHKQELVSKLKDLWVGARDALIKADAIVFIGYRFPQSDTGAMRHFLDAIVNNSSKRLYLHAVLGPDSGSLDSVRLLELLGATIARTGREDQTKGDRALRERTYKITSHRFWSTDFIMSYDRDNICR